MFVRMKRGILALKAAVLPLISALFTAFRTIWLFIGPPALKLLVSLLTGATAALLWVVPHAVRDSVRHVVEVIENNTLRVSTSRLSLCSYYPPNYEHGIHITFPQTLASELSGYVRDLGSRLLASLVVGREWTLSVIRSLSRGPVLLFIGGTISGYLIGELVWRFLLWVPNPKHLDIEGERALKGRLWQHISGSLTNLSWGRFFLRKHFDAGKWRALRWMMLD